MAQMSIEKLSLSRTLSLSRVIATCFLFLSGCQAESEILTDEQLVLLFGERTMFTDESDLQISNKTVECVRLISGLDEEIYKDAPADMLGRIKTECRMDLDAKIKHTKLGNAKLTLNDIGNKAIAERLTALKQRIDADLKAKAEDARKKELSDRTAKIRDSLARVEKEATRFAGSLETQFRDIDRLCDDWKKLKDQIVKADKNSKYRWRFTPTTCGQTFRENLQRQMVATVQRLAEAKAKEPSEVSEFIIPSLHYINSFNEVISSLAEEVKTMQAMTAKVN
ncbi:hypothetical protein [Microvirga sp. CF3016]|uniref:hypothetical protein n=1 Tax=Microvirga sp. CF3016 TaxID=3110181 RepID=UPI002E76F8C0|nr:hypothetical protein [Microvirga sp. CF3016]MEE1610720.1 hypothetical protein [Microvirga sp. CF3016]